MASSLLMQPFKVYASRNILKALSANGYSKFPVQMHSFGQSVGLQKSCIQQFQQLQVAKLTTSAVKLAAPEIEQAGHDHVNHWTAERVLSVGLIGLIPAAVVFPSAGLEYLLALTLTMHSHWGIEAIVVDYVRPSIVGNFVAKASVGAVYALSALTLGGLMYFIYTDVGIVNAVRMLWKL